MKRKKVLMITYLFPPIGGSAVHRNLGFVKHLQKFNWTPIVISGDEASAYGIGYDHTLVSEIPPQTKIFRVSFKSAYKLRNILKEKLGFVITKRRLSKSGDQLLVTDVDHNEDLEPRSTNKPVFRKIFGILGKVLEPIEKPFIDAGLYWALSIIPKSFNIIREEKVDLIYSQSFPYSDHVPGYILHLITGLPWVVDFHDPWSRNATFKHSGIRRKIDVFVEKMILKSATKVVACTPPYTRDFNYIVPHRDSVDFITIETGFDPKDFDKLANSNYEQKIPWTAEDNKVTLAHVGNVFPYSAIPFLQAIAKLEKEYPDNFRVVFIGGLALPDAKWLKQNPVPIEIVLTERLTLMQAAQAMKSADAVLLLVAQGTDWLGHYPAKTYDYLQSGSPIFYSGPDGTCADLIRKTGTGCIGIASNPIITKELLNELITDPGLFQKKYFKPNESEISKYNRIALTKKLSQVFNQASAK